MVYIRLIITSMNIKTSQELVAEAIHDESRRKGNFVALNCAAIPSELIEAELFGFEKGAFTGALKTTLGKFEQANKGTLFLDEIGDMPFGVQTKLLRVVENSIISKVGIGKRKFNPTRMYRSASLFNGR